MASELKIRVPDGQFCMDKHYLGCLYDACANGDHSCQIYGSSLDKLEIQDENGERRRVLYKCKGCLEAAQQTTEKSDEIQVSKILAHEWVYP